MIYTKESTHYYIVANIWIATAVLADHIHDVIFASVLGLLWFVYALYTSRKEKEDEANVEVR